MPPKYAVQVENSAPSQGKPAKSVEWASQILKTEKVKSVVDLGCGRLRNLPVLQKYFKKIALVDTKFQCDRIAGLAAQYPTSQLMAIDNFTVDEKTYDAIFLISVLHVIDKLSVRKELLSIAKHKLREFGFLVVDVPTGIQYYRVHCTPDNKHGDGWVMGSGNVKTFYRSYSARELDKLVVSTTSFELYKKIWYDKHIIRIWQK